ncbi:MAG TPA: HTTM domain-containing protein [Thermoanaerobaculia bacterium]|nr:HTTM domain-containing protein [Thermoanaerobaculia bacterium]
MQPDSGERPEPLSPQALLASALRFLLEPARPEPLALFRIGIASFELVLSAVLWPYLLQLYGQLGFVQWPVGELIIFPWLPTTGRLAEALEPLGIAPAAWVYGLYGAYLASLVGLLAGWKTRFMAAVAWLIHMTLMNGGFFSTYGVDLIVHICLFYCIWMPVGDCLSLDRRARGTPATPSPMARLSIRTLQIHLCIIYLTAGVSKTGGVEWWNGEAVWLSVMQPQFARMDFTWLASTPWVPMAAGWSVMLVELGYAFFMWPRRTRGVWLGATVALHLGIGLFLGLWFFAAVMILFNVCAFGYPWLVSWGTGAAFPPEHAISL